MIISIIVIKNMTIRCVRICNVMIMRMRDIFIVGINTRVTMCARVTSTIFTSSRIRSRSRSRTRSIGSRIRSSRRRRCSCSSRRRRRRCRRRRM